MRFSRARVGTLGAEDPGTNLGASRYGLEVRVPGTDLTDDPGTDLPTVHSNQQSENRIPPPPRYGLAINRFLEKNGPSKYGPSVTQVRICRDPGTGLRAQAGILDIGGNR